MGEVNDCKWGKFDCKYCGEKCHLCTSNGYYYLSTFKQKSFTKKAKVTKRQGSLFEARNHDNNEALLVSSSMTPNSGAGKIKGDEEIKGIINIMEELKTHHTKNSGRVPGKESFTVQKSWLMKLNREAKEAQKEFWYLKFAFKNEDFDHYIVVESDTIMSMVATMVEDRKIAKLCDSKIEVAEKRSRLFEAESVKYYAENELLKAQIKELNLLLDMKGIGKSEDGDR